MKKILFTGSTILLLTVCVFNIFPISPKIKVGITTFTDETAKVNKKSIRQTIAKHLNSKGFSASLVESSKDAGNFDYFISVDIKNTRKTSETTITATLYGKDGKTIVRQVKTSRDGTDDDSLRKMGGTDDDSLRPVIIKLLDSLTEKMKG